MDGQPTIRLFGSIAPKSFLPDFLGQFNPTKRTFIIKVRSFYYFKIIDFTSFKRIFGTQGNMHYGYEAYTVAIF